MLKPPLKTEEKLDLILKYIKSARRWAMFRGLISFIFFLVFIVLPVIGGAYLWNYIKNFDWSRLQNIQAQFEEFKNFGDTFKKFGEDFMKIKQ